MDPRTMQAPSPGRPSTGPPVMHGPPHHASRVRARVGARVRVRARSRAKASTRVRARVRVRVKDRQLGCPKFRVVVTTYVFTIAEAKKKKKERGE